MLLVRLMAEEIRHLRAAKAEADLRGAVDMVLHKVDEAEAGRLFKPTGRQSKYNWAAAYTAMAAVLGEENLTKPPFPEGRWYQRVGTALRENGADDEWCTKLANYIKENLRLPISFQFAVEQNQRIMGGAFNGGYAKPLSGAAAHKSRSSAPLVDSLPKLPED